MRKMLQEEKLDVRAVFKMTKKKIAEEEKSMAEEKRKWKENGFCGWQSKGMVNYWEFWRKKNFRAKPPSCRSLPHLFIWNVCPQRENLSGRKAQRRPGDNLFPKLESDFERFAFRSVRGAFSPPSSGSSLWFFVVPGWLESFSNFPGAHRRRLPRPTRLLICQFGHGPVGKFQKLCDAIMKPIFHSKVIDQLTRIINYHFHTLQFRAENSENWRFHFAEHVVRDVAAHLFIWF